MNDLNDVKLTCRAVSEPKSFGKVVFLNVAVSESQKDSNGNFLDDKAHFLSIKAFGKTANSLLKNVIKGSKLFISAKLVQDKYTDKNGLQVDKMGLIVESYELINKKERAEATYQAPRQQETYHPEQQQQWKAEESDIPTYTQIEPEDDIPF